MFVDLSSPMPSPFADLQFIDAGDHWRASFSFEGERFDVRGKDRESLTKRICDMQLALYTVPADQWDEIRSRESARYELRRADGSAFSVAYLGEGLPLCSTALNEGLRLDVLRAPGKVPPVLGLVG